MKLAVSFWRDQDNPHNIPPEWPARVMELYKDDKIPRGFVEMSEDEYNRYREQHQPKYDRWYAKERKPLIDTIEREQKAI